MIPDVRGTQHRFVVAGKKQRLHQPGYYQKIYNYMCRILYSVIDTKQEILYIAYIFLSRYFAKFLLNSLICSLVTVIYTERGCVMKQKFISDILSNFTSLQYFSNI